jgi:hypothetical protein
MHTHFWVSAEIARQRRAELIAAADTHRERPRRSGQERPANLGRWWHNAKVATAPVALVISDNRG